MERDVLKIKTHALNVEGWKKVYHPNNNRKLLYQTEDFKGQSFTRKKG